MTPLVLSPMPHMLQRKQGFPAGGTLWIPNPTRGSPHPGSRPGRARNESTLHIVRQVWILALVVVQRCGSTDPRQCTPELVRPTRHQNLSQDHRDGHHEDGDQDQPAEGAPEGGLTTVQVIPWQNHIKSYLTEERITEVKNKDVTNNEGMLVPFLNNILLTDTKKEENIGQYTAAQTQLKRKLATLSNNQLAKIIEHIVSFVHYTVQNNIDQNSTLIGWIWTYLENHYNIYT